MKLATIINYCSNDERFLFSCIEGVKPFSSEIIVVVCDHFFDGRKENFESLHKAFEAFSNVTFVLYPYFDLSHYKIFQKVGANNFWHSLSRMIGFEKLSSDIDYVIFLDADEVVDSKSFSSFLSRKEYQNYDVMKLANYWYFREPIYQATTWEDSVILIRKNKLSKSLLMRKEERNALYDNTSGKKARKVVGLDDRPMIHHYSWVRSQEEMLRKVETWGHRQDKNWVALVKEEFLHPFKGKDFVHGYSYETVPSILQEPLYKKLTSDTSIVLSLSSKDVQKSLRWLEILSYFNLVS
jgi:hypothetical protein